VTFAVALVVVVVALGSLDYYTYETLNSQLSNTKADLNDQIAGLQNTVTSQGNSISSLQNTFASLQSDVTSLQSTATSLGNALTNLQGTLSSLQNTVNQNQQSDAASIQQIQSSIQSIQTQLQNVTLSINAINTRLSTLFPQIPLTTLVIVNSSYDSSTSTYSFKVQNNLNAVVYAQINAELLSAVNTNCGGILGTYESQILTFGARSVTLSTMDLADGTYTGICNYGSINPPVTSIQVTFVAASTTVSQAYPPFPVVPPYQEVTI
jgi:prefoldin subunit 5